MSVKGGGSSLMFGNSLIFVGPSGLPKASTYGAAIEGASA
jgi:hypothetical protein